MGGKWSKAKTVTIGRVFFGGFFPSQELVGRLRAVRIFVHVLTARTVTLNFGAVSKGGGKKDLL